MPTPRPTLLLPPLAAILLCLAILTHAEPPSATYAHGSLSLTLPYHSTAAGSGRLVAEMLDPEGRILARTERRTTIAQGDSSWQQSLAPPKSIPFEDLIWQRVRYRFDYGSGHLPAIEDTESISQILRRPLVRVLGQTEYLAGSQAALRVIVADSANPDVPLPGTLRIALVCREPNATPRPLFSGQLNHRGTLEAQLKFPANLTGSYLLRFSADTPIGVTDYTQPIQLRDQASILLTTEKAHLSARPEHPRPRPGPEPRRPPRRHQPPAHLRGRRLPRQQGLQARYLHRRLRHRLRRVHPRRRGQSGHLPSPRPHRRPRGHRQHRRSSPQRRPLRPAEVQSSG